MENKAQNEPKNSQVEKTRRRFLCPLCGKHTVLWLLPETEVKNLPIKCKRCGKESVITIPPITED